MPRLFFFLLLLLLYHTITFVSLSLGAVNIDLTGTCLKETSRAPSRRRRSCRSSRFRGSTDSWHSGGLMIRSSTPLQVLFKCSFCHCSDDLCSVLLLSFIDHPYAVPPVIHATSSSSSCQNISVVTRHNCSYLPRGVIPSPSSSCWYEQVMCR